MQIKQKIVRKQRNKYHELFLHYFFDEIQNSFMNFNFYEEDGKQRINYSLEMIRLRWNKIKFRSMKLLMIHEFLSIAQ